MTPIEELTAKEMAEVANAAKAVEDRRVADAQVAVSNQPVALPAGTPLVATSAVPTPAKPSIGSRLKADLQADLLAVETAFKKVEAEG